MSNELKADLKELLVKEKDLTPFCGMLCLIAIISLPLVLFKMIIRR